MFTDSAGVSFLKYLRQKLAPEPGAEAADLLMG